MKASPQGHAKSPPRLPSTSRDPCFPSILRMPIADALPEPFSVFFVFSAIIMSHPCMFLLCHDRPDGCDGSGGRGASGGTGDTGSLSASIVDRNACSWPVGRTSRKGCSTRPFKHEEEGRWATCSGRLHAIAGLSTRNGCDHSNRTCHAVTRSFSRRSRV